jgi:hypothetical protein
MSTPYESAQLILKIFELRRDPLLRDARTWFLRSFHPKSVSEISGLSADENRMYRMVTGYWDMAASFVTHGAIDRQMFLDANGEIFGAFSKVYPFLVEIREVTSPAHLKHVEEVVLSVPGIEARLASLRETFRKSAEATGKA